MPNKSTQYYGYIEFKPETEVKSDEVLKLVPISVSGLYQKISDGEFPRPLNLA